MLRMGTTWLVGLTVAGLIVGAASPPVFAADLRPSLGSEISAGRGYGTGPGGIDAPEAAVADAQDGAILWARERNAERPVASITKVMTALVVLRSGGLDRKVMIPRAVSSYVTENDASNAGLRPGDRLRAGQLLYALLLPSGADAAYALAQVYGPGSPAFVARMNAVARHLGLRHTRFTNFDGLPYPSGDADYSTAADLVRLGRAAMTWRTFRQVVGAHAYRVRSYDWRNLNPLIGRPGVLGIKGGWTTAAGQCLLFAARRHGASLIGVVLHEPSVSSVIGDANRLLDWGFARLSAGDSAGCAGMGTETSWSCAGRGVDGSGRDGSAASPSAGPLMPGRALRRPGFAAAMYTAASQKARQPRMMTHITQRRQSEVSRLISITVHLIGITRPTSVRSRSSQNESRLRRSGSKPDRHAHANRGPISCRRFALVWPDGSGPPGERRIVEPMGRMVESSG
jgi:D-alanyl-D-alanine carboxypeptidase (penicillin-binding protein 5/6)